MTDPLPDLPGAVGITALRFYDWEAADGLCGGGALEAFHAAAAALVRPQLPRWRQRWEQGAAAVSARTGQQIDALAAGDHRHLREATVARIPQPEPSGPGMCGHLSPYDPVRSPPSG
ncbi:hypothetical protein [Pseudonocardia sp. MH-G8]|uniref:hypothetical protein n=1 Tax=Pseudonocardia sp. MH-G8 TaxID=1854588 RepID=UPI000BA170D5|nr:hypothetical protein [Pseudonocardia sp. MH-G8]OZM82613.1 hypothetical protein CFP66_07785 [Pseudonocardia sp. MH-G8]